MYESIKLVLDKSIQSIDQVKSNLQSIIEEKEILNVILIEDGIDPKITKQVMHYLNIRGLNTKIDVTKNLQAIYK